MSKSYVTVAVKQCPICGKQTNSNEVLFDRKMRDVFEHHTVVGYGLCEEHENDEYIYVLEAEKINKNENKLLGRYLRLVKDFVVEDMRSNKVMLADTKTFEEITKNLEL